MNERPVEEAWSFLLDLRRRRRKGGGRRTPVRPAFGGDAAAAQLLDLHLLIAAGGETGSFVVAHLGQSLDGYIATPNGASHYITGAADLDHNHRLRALCDVVLVGAGTVRLDNPALTVRRVAGDSPVRVVLDTERSLGADLKLFADDGPPTFLCCADDKATDSHLGQAEIVGMPRMEPGGLHIGALVEFLAGRGWPVVFVEGGGQTVSGFLQAGALDRLQITVAPLILGAGRPGISLPALAHPADGLRPTVRHFELGEDVLFDCALA